MFSAFRILYLFSKNLVRTAKALEEIRDLYRLDLATRGITPIVPGVHDEVDVAYGYQAAEED